MQPGTVLVNFGAAAGCHRTSRSACSQAARGETREKRARHARSLPRTHDQKDSQRLVRDSRTGSPMPFSRSESQAPADEASGAGSRRQSNWVPSVSRVGDLDSVLSSDFWVPSCTSCTRAFVFSLS